MYLCVHVYSNAYVFVCVLEQLSVCVCLAAFMLHLIAAVDSIRLTACQILIKKMHYIDARSEIFRVLVI